MSKENTPFIDLNDYVIHHFNNLKVDHELLYNDINYNYVPIHTANTDSIIHLSQSPETTQNTSSPITSFCTSPTLVPSSTAVAIQPSFFPSPSASPYQHSLESMCQRNENNQYPNFLQYSELHTPNKEGTHSADYHEDEDRNYYYDPMVTNTNPVLSDYQQIMVDMMPMDHELKSEVDPSEFYHLKEEDTAFRNKNTHSIHTKKNLSSNKLSNSELRRITHIQSEQKRRAQIKDGFEELRSELPSYINKKMSKVVLLQRTVQHIKHLKSTHIAILGELERIAEENSRLRKFQNNVLQNQSMESMYHAHTNSSSNSSSRSSSSGSSG